MHYRRISTIAHISCILCDNFDVTRRYLLLNWASEIKIVYFTDQVNDDDFRAVETFAWTPFGGYTRYVYSAIFNKDIFLHAINKLWIPKFSVI